MAKGIRAISSFERMVKSKKAQELQGVIHAAGPACIEQGESCGRKHVRKGLEGAFIRSRVVTENVVSDKKSVRDGWLKQ